ncbi:MAG: class I SAM-dependent methyltransferase, partial [Chloroflexi bacterium]|nr:class I SAM-dependent methyltransferase [Chloroflexota bacterium]
MGYNGPEFFDDEAVFATYVARRAEAANAVDTLEKPVFDGLAGELAGLRILDLGCGGAGFGREALAKGCRSYLGVEGSHKMVELARATLAGTAGEVVHDQMETWSYPAQRFDLVTSRLALHYVAEIGPIFGHVYQALVAGGRFIFSVEHPVITSCDRAWAAGGARQEWIVDDYFETGRRVTTWLGGEVVKYHRTVEDYFMALRSAGFRVDKLRESRPQRALFADEA